MNEIGSQIEVLRSRQAVESLAASWDELEQARENPLLSFRWFRAAATLHSDNALHVVAVSNGSRLVGIAPMACTRRHGVDWLEFIGAAALHEPANLLAIDDPSLQRVCETLIAAKRPLILQRIPVDSQVHARLATCARGRGIVVLARSAPCLRVDISEPWDVYLSRRSSQVRSGLRRKRVLLEQAGPLVFDSLRPAPEELPTVFEEALDVEADGWKSATGSSMRQNAAIRGFVRELAERFAVDGRLRICFLRAGNRAVAMGLLIEHGMRLWEIKIGHRESASRASPGRLLLWEMLREAFGRELRGYEFLGSGDGQQPDWANGTQRLQTLVFYPWNLQGLWALTMDAIMRVVRRLRR